MIVKKSILILIKIYQKTVSPDHGLTPFTASGIFSFWLKKGLTSPSVNNTCRFYPTCSEYAHEAIDKFGIKRGLVLSIKRVLRCHPWNAGGYDPVE